MKVLIWGETREKVWATANSVKDLVPDSNIIIGCGDPYQQDARILESFAGFCNHEFESGYNGKLDFIAKHKEDAFVFAVQGVLFNPSMADYLKPYEGNITFFNLGLDDGRFLANCSPTQGGFLEATETMRNIPGGQSLLCFASGGKINYPEFFKGGYGEGLTLSQVNPSEIVKGYFRYNGNLDLQITQAGFFNLVMGLKTTGLFEEHGEEVSKIVEEEVRDRVYKKVEKELNNRLS